MFSLSFQENCQWTYSHSVHTLRWWCSSCLFSPLSTWKKFHSWVVQHVRKYICVIISRVFSSLLFVWVCFTLYNFTVQFSTSLLLIAQTDRDKKQLADKRKARSLLLMVALAYTRLNHFWDFSVWWSILYARINVFFFFLSLMRIHFKSTLEDYDSTV